MYYKLYFWVMLFLGLASFPSSYGKVNIMPVSLFFEFLIFSSILLKPPHINRSSLCLLIVLLLYVSCSFAFSVFVDNDHIFDFLLVYKVIIYLIVLILFVGRSFDSLVGFVSLYRIILALFFLKYFISVAFQLDLRPQLYRENNFELMFLALLFYLRHLQAGKVPAVEWVALSFIFVFSFSRSGLFVYVFLVSVVLFDRVSLRRIVCAIPVVLALLLLFYLVVVQRSGSEGLSSIDRIVFLKIFLEQMSEASLKEWLIGVTPVTPLSQSSCSALRFYEGLFSYKANGECYSVILHSFVLRAIYDFGLLGLLLIVAITHYFVTKSGYGRRAGYVVNSILLLNGLSVSSYNSYFFPLALILYIGYGSVINGPRSLYFQRPEKRVGRFCYSPA